MISEVVVDARRVRLDPRELLGEGGEGRVFRAGDRAIKVFFDPTPARRAKLAAFPARLPPAVLAPAALAHDPATGDVVGYAMRLAAGARPFADLTRRAVRDAGVRAVDVLHLCRELVRTVRDLHARGVVAGDPNDGNVLVRPPASGAPGEIFLIDADSMQLPGHPCVVAHERFLDPRLYGADLAQTPALSRATDAYALAVLLFSALVCVHPFGGTHPSHPTLLRRAEARVSVLSPGVKLPKVAFSPAILPDDALAFFTGVFEGDVRDETALVPEHVLALPFTRCACGLEHARRTCPACTTSALVRPRVRTHGALRVTTVLRAPRGGRVVTAAVARGALLTLHHDGAELVREDGARLPGELQGRFRLVPHATWVLDGARAVRFGAAGARTSVPTSTALAYGEPAADAGPGGLVTVDGDALVRHEAGTRVGQVLARQTWVRVSERLGFAFYRAGALTVAFLFDVARGPLRQLDMPPLEGRVVRANAAFDDHHVLFRAVTEANGRVEHVAHLFDDRGNRLASARGAAGTSPLFSEGAESGELEDACLFHGAILCATADGLVLLRADPAARVFETRRLFEGTKDFASPDAAMLVGPGGSVYVRQHDEIVHLGFTEAGGPP